MNGAELFVKALENEGVEYIFGLPGEENLHVVEALRKSKKIGFIITRHEQAAAFMAATYGRLTGKPGVCLSTLGPGALNLLTGVAFAQLGGMPLVAITGQKPFKKNWQAKFQLIDVVSAMRPVTKKATSIYSSTGIPSLVREAFRLAEQERPGAVHLELPEDVAAENVLESDAVFVESSKIRRPAPDPKAIDQAVALLKKAKRPIVIVSGGGNRKRISKQLNNFINSTGIYVTHTQLGKGVIRDDNEKSLFTIGIHKEDYVHCGINKADLVVTIGYDTVEYPPFVWNRMRDKKILHIDFNPASVDTYYNPELEVIGDISNALWQLSERLAEEKTSYDFAYYKRLRGFLLAKFGEKNGSGSFPLKPQRIVNDVRRAMREEDIISLDNGIYKLWFSRLYKAYAPNTVLLDNALATMGAGFSSALVAKMVYPKKRVLAVVGDGGFMMNSQELETAVRLRKNVVCLILNDNAFGFIKWEQASHGYRPYAMDYGNPDFKKYAEAYGAKGFEIRKAGGLVPALEKAFAQKGPVLISCPIDYSENKRVFSKELSNIVCPV